MENGEQQTYSDEALELGRTFERQDLLDWCRLKYGCVPSWLQPFLVQSLTQAQKRIENRKNETMEKEQSEVKPWRMESKPPDLKFDPNGILQNWNDVFNWALDNNALWNRCREQYGHLSKLAFLEALSAHQLEQNHNLHNQLMKALAVQRQPVRIQE